MNEKAFISVFQGKSVWTMLTIVANDSKSSIRHNLIIDAVIADNEIETQQPWPQTKHNSLIILYYHPFIKTNYLDFFRMDDAAMPDWGR